MAEPSCLSAWVGLDHPGGNESGVPGPAIGIEIEAPLTAESGEFFQIKVHSDRGVARAVDLLLGLVGAVEPLLKGFRQVGAVPHQGADAGIAIGSVPGNADGASARQC